MTKEQYNKLMQRLFDQFVTAMCEGREEDAQALSLEIAENQCTYAEYDDHVSLVTLEGV